MDPLNHTRDSGRLYKPATEVTWRVARSALWSLSWRFYLGQFAIAAVVGVLAKYFGESGGSDQAPRELDDLVASLPPLLATLVSVAEIGLILQAFRATVRKHLPGASGRVSWGATVFCLWGFFWRFFPGTFGAVILVFVGLKVIEPAFPVLIPNFWIGLVVGVIIIFWPLYAGQVWALRGALRALLRRANRMEARRRRAARHL